MITVYWSPWTHIDNYHAYNICFGEPIPLIKHLQSKINHNNLHDNFMKCPAHLDYIKNIYTLNAPFDIDAQIINNQFVDMSHKKSSDMSNYYKIKTDSLNDSRTVNVHTNWIFYCEESLFIETMPPFMHNTKMKDYGFYVPGTYDINKWFRPVEGAIQMWPKMDRLICPMDEPLIYLKLNTNEPVQFKRFYMTEEIFNLSKSCIHLKQFKTIKNLNKLYEIFLKNKLDKRLSRLIKQNLVD